MFGWSVLRAWLRRRLRQKTSTSQPPSHPTRPGARPRLETLEDRLPPGSLLGLDWWELDPLTPPGDSSSVSILPESDPTDCAFFLTEPTDNDPIAPPPDEPINSASLDPSTGYVIDNGDEIDQTANTALYLPGGLDEPPTSGMPEGPLEVAISGITEDTGVSASDLLTNARTLSVFGTATPGATVTVYAGSEEVSVQAGADGTWTARLTQPLPEGFQFLTVVAASGTGNFAATGQSIVIDRTAPEVLLQAPTYTLDTTPTVLVTARDTDFNGLGNTVAIDVDRNRDGVFSGPGELNFATADRNADGATEVTLAALQPGRYDLRARVADAAGNDGVSATIVTEVSGDPFARMPLNFEQNRGQADPSLQFLARGQDYMIGLTGSGAVLSMTSVVPPTGLPSEPGMMTGDASGETPRTYLTETVQVNFLGAMPTDPAFGVNRLEGVANYFVGNDPSSWLTDVPMYSEVHYQNAYDGIDVAYHGDQGNLRYDFLVRPDADAGQIQLDFQGAQSVAVNEQGQLVLGLQGGELVQSAPVAYQETATGRQAVAAAYVQAGPNQIGIQVGNYDHTRTLVIDPTLNFSTYVGGNGNDNDPIFGPDQNAGIQVDSAGNAYVVTTTSSSNFPITPGAFQTTTPGGGDAVVFKMNPTGTALVYSTYLGGNGGDTAFDLDIDAAGNAYVSGSTGSNNFPVTTGAFQATRAGGARDVFVSKLNSNGNALIYSTFLGGDGVEHGVGITVDGAGSAYVVGQTDSDNFDVTTGAFQSTRAGNDDVFVTKLNTTGTALVYSTYLGGSAHEGGDAVEVDSAGNAYITGETSSDNFDVTTGAFQSTRGGGRDAFITKLNPTGTALVYSTYLGGTGADEGTDLALDTSNNAYIVGTTGSSNFDVTTGAFRTTLTTASFTDAFVTKINTTGTALVYSTYLGGNFDDTGRALVVDASGNAIVTGAANAGLPLVNQFSGSGFINTGTNRDIYVSVFNATGTALTFSTYLGGFSVDAGHDVAIGSSGDIWVTGTAISSDFPTTPGAFQTTKGSGPGTTDLVVARINANVVTPPGPGGGGTFTGDNYESNETSDQAADRGILGATQSYTGLTLARKADGLYDYDWYRWTAGASGTVTVQITQTGGDMELRLFTLAGNSLVELGSNTAPGQATRSVSAAVAAGAPILVQVKGRNSSLGVMDQGSYTMNVTLA